MDHIIFITLILVIVLSVLQSGISVVASSTSVNQGELVRFQCQVQGSPTPDVSWEINREPLPLPLDNRYY